MVQIFTCSFKNKTTGEEGNDQGTNTSRPQAALSTHVPCHKPCSEWGPLSSTPQLACQHPLCHILKENPAEKNPRAEAKQTRTGDSWMGVTVSFCSSLPVQLITETGSLCFCCTIQAALSLSLGSTVVASLSNWNRVYNKSNKPHINVLKETDNVILPVPLALQFLKGTEPFTYKDTLVKSVWGWCQEDWAAEHRLKLTQIYWNLLFVATISLERDICEDAGGNGRSISVRTSEAVTAPPFFPATF